MEIPQPVVMYQVMAAEQVPPGGPLPPKTRQTAKNEKSQGDHFYERHD